MNLADLSTADDKFHEECAVAAVINHPESANLVYLALYAQQHRGQEGAGVLTYDGNFKIHKGIGLVADVFNDFDFAQLAGDKGIGHVRYSTAGGGSLVNIQPFSAMIAKGPVGLAHNGNLTNADALRKELIKKGSILSSSSDSELFLHILAHEQGEKRIDNILGMLSKVKGAYSLVMLFEDSIFGIRDPNGLRPLCIGKIGEGYIIASETCALDLVGAEFVREVEPGEVVEITKEKGIVSHIKIEGMVTPCIFEYIYFARPDSQVFGRDVYTVRKRLGAQLAKESNIAGDLVVPVPDSGIPAALGYAQASGIPLELGLIRNHYVGRTFIEPKQSIRDFGVKIKLNPNPSILRGKEVIVVDDSIVRGTTSRKIIQLFRQAGASKVHLRISAPPTIASCYYGIDTPQPSELIANKMNLEEIREYVGADTLCYLSISGMYEAVQGDKTSACSFCDACFTSNYPIKIG